MYFEIVTLCRDFFQKWIPDTFVETLKEEETRVFERNRRASEKVLEQTFLLHGLDEESIG